MDAESFGLVAVAALFAALVRAAVPIVFAALGGLITEIAGVVNVALEGMLLLAAFGGVFGSAYCAMLFPGLPAWAHALAGCAAGLGLAVAASLALAALHLEWGADIVAAGIVMNMLAAASTVFLMASLTGDKGSTASLASALLPSVHVPGLALFPAADRIANGEDLRGHHVLAYAALASAIGVAFALRHSVWGLRLRAVGENELAARIAGLPVRKLRYQAMAVSGLLAGLGGVYLSMGYLNLFQADISGGRGFLALAAVFLGARTTAGTCAAALAFGAAAVAAAQLGLLDVPTQIVFMAPPLLTLAVMVLLGLRRRSPSYTLH